MTTMRKRGYPLNQSPFYKLTTRKRLAELLGLTPKGLERIAVSAQKLYQEWDSTNAKGKIRHIENPAKHLKEIQRRISKILSRISPPDYLYCPVKRRCYISNAAHHIGAKQIRNLDISSFYPSSKAQRVYWFFHKIMLCSPDVAGTLVSLTTRNGHLPCGSPASGMLGFYAYYDMWQEIERISLDNKCKLSVYVDDITISGDVVSPGVMFQIRKCVIRAGLTPNKSKERFYKRGRGVITGIIVGPGGLSTPKSAHLKRFTLRKQLRSAISLAEIAKLKRKLRGMDCRETLIRRWNEELEANGLLACREPASAETSN